MKQIWTGVILIGCTFLCRGIVIELDDVVYYEENKDTFIFLGTTQLGRKGISISDLAANFIPGRNILARYYSADDVSWYTVHEFSDVQALGTMAADAHQDVAIEWFSSK